MYKIKIIGAGVGIALTLMSNLVMAANIDYIMFSEWAGVSQDVHILPGARLYINHIDINRSVLVENAGYVSGDVFVGDGNSLSIRNQGEFNGAIHLGQYAQVIQLVDSYADITDIHVDGPWTIAVGRGNAKDADLQLGDIMAMGADRIILDGATIRLGDIRRSPNRMPELVLNGSVMMYVDVTRDMDGMVLMENVSGRGTLNLVAPDLDCLYIVVGRRDGDRVYMDIRRETDYIKILGPNVGGFINHLRGWGGAAKMLNALDTAETRDEIDGILHRSVRLNPMHLMRAGRLINSFRMADAEIHPGIGVHDVRLWSSDIDMRGLGIDVGVRMGAFSVGINGIMADFRLSDDFDDFDGTLYGGDIRVRVDYGRMWMRLVGGINGARFDVGPVWGGHDVVWNPNGMAGYGIWDIGMRLNVENFYAVPFVGMGMWYDKIAGIDRLTGRMRAGAAVGYRYEIDGIGYDYAVRTSASDGAIIVGVTMTAYSREDGVSGDLGWDVYRDDTMTTHRVRVGMRYAF